MTWTIRLPLLSVLAIAAACEAPPPAEPAREVTTVSQVIDRDRVLRVVEELRVDGSREDVAFFRLTAAALDDLGNMYVLDAGNSQVAVFDPQGTPIRTIGRRGEGPGEFSRARGIALYSGVLGVSDAGNRVHLFRTDGTHIATRAHLEVMDGNDLWMLGAISGGPGGWFLRGSAFFRRDASGNDAALPPVQRQTAFRLEDDGSIEEAGFYHAHENVGEMVGPYFVQPPFIHSPISAMDGLGRIHVVETGDYVIDVYDSSGEALYRVENEIDRAEVTRADLDQWREERACPPGAMECDEGRNELALSMEIPELKPVVGRMVAFTHGHIAVMRRWTDPDPTDRLSMGEYDLFDPDGVFLGRLPVGLSPRWFDGETLLATEWDEMMVPSMVRYRVEQP